MRTNIRVGTSGYSFDDWRLTFYPHDIDKGKMLDHYVKFFPTVEINSTYYRTPHPAVMNNILKKAPPGFDFAVKLPQSFTHRRSDLDSDLRKFTESLRPMRESGRLSALLAQFPYSFKYSPDGLDYICACRDALSADNLFVEFRHNGWVNRPMYERLKSEGIGYVCVDEPQLDGLLKPDMFATTDVGYLRLHGRNAAQWWDGGERRYDYHYSAKEMGEWKAKLLKLLSKVKKAFVYFNNCYEGQAVNNALEFQQSLTEE